jgi:hypothetical protein
VGAQACARVRVQEGIRVDALLGAPVVMDGEDLWQACRLACGALLKGAAAAELEVRRGEVRWETTSPSARLAGRVERTVDGVVIDGHGDPGQETAWLWVRWMDRARAVLSRAFLLWCFFRLAREDYFWSERASSFEPKKMECRLKAEERERKRKRKEKETEKEKKRKGEKEKKRKREKEKKND